jgi:hypothetical protein
MRCVAVPTAGSGHAPAYQRQRGWGAPSHRGTLSTHTGYSVYSQRYSEYSLLHLRIDGSVYRAERSEQRRVHEAHHDAAQRRTAFCFRKHGSISAVPTGIAVTQRIRVGCNCRTYALRTFRPPRAARRPAAHARTALRASSCAAASGACQRSAALHPLRLEPTVCAVQCIGSSGRNRSALTDEIVSQRC